MLRLILYFTFVIFALHLIVACGAKTPDVEGPDPVAELLSLEIGGMDQWILIRGEDQSNPVLLWLHGGPGSAQMPVHRAFNKELEREFIVVHWDQRGAGKSNHNEFRVETMTLDRFVEDAHELTIYLKERFNKEKIFLLGHSWGTQFGILTVERFPEDYHAFISVGQVVHPERANFISYEWLKNEVEQNGSRRQKREFSELGEPSFLERRRYVSLAEMLDQFGGGMDVGMGRLAWISLGACEYTLGDYMKWLRGASRGSGPMWEESSRMNLFDRVPKLEVPAWFIVGRNDFNTPAVLVSEYVEKMNAPHKELIVMEGAAHTPFLKNPDGFNAEVIRIKKSIVQKKEGL